MKSIHVSKTSSMQVTHFPFMLDLGLQISG